MLFNFFYKISIFLFLISENILFWKYVFLMNEKVGKSERASESKREKEFLYFEILVKIDLYKF